jgi:FlaA1/EpsC-like NDP-sugar epimerase
MSYLDHKTVLVTGCCGTVGAELIDQLLRGGQHNPAQVIGIDNNESALFFQEQRYLTDCRVHFFVADIRDRDKVIYDSRGTDIIFHTAALKHVVMCERSPMEAVQTNIHGVENVIHAANTNNVQMVVFTSSDKAVNPTNVMGTSKLMGERLITAANSSKRNGGPVFVSTRFGNVLGSNGSVIPIFESQIANGGPVTLTDPDMTRFIMSIDQSVQLVIGSCELARGGEVFITKMPVVRIADLAEVMIEELAPHYGYAPSDIKIEIIGTKPGEKMYEELMSDEETRRSIELEDYFVVTPAFTGLYHSIEYDYPHLTSIRVTSAYNSALQLHLSKSDLRTYLNGFGLLRSGEDTNIMPSRYWPGDKEETVQ